ncbi:hypothetical protein [Sphingomonas sp. Leaf21]|jgi:hypothetical protein|uniref:hypothetical protein n=1 Tax=Sphingomonas sp. Leaf21 TaxID=2876550 RepID=UPI001E654A56|nr:hypothetical protein [Sphingomonas sp. Leaf21]
MIAVARFIVPNALMNDVISSVTMREVAAAFWMSALLVWVAAYKPTRGSFKEVLKALFQPILLIPLGIAALYAGAEITLLHRVGWWSVANLKTTVIWLVTFAFVTMFEVATAKSRKAGFGKIVHDIVTVTGILVFITELYSFPLLVEIIALPVVTMIVMTAEMAKRKPDDAPAAKLLGCVASFIGFSYLGFSLWKSFQSWSTTATWANGLEFLIPILLSLGFLPFLYGWRTYVAYSEMFTTLSVFGLDKALIPYARWLAVTRIGSDLDTLERWRKAIQSTRPSDKAELRHTLTALSALQEREKSPPVVQPKDGWSPYLAMQFLTDMGVDTGHYHHSFDGEWFASSPMREMGDSLILRNNIAYYIDGTEQAATTLKVKLNINDPEKGQEAEDIFILQALLLLEKAVSMDAIERMKMQIASLSPFEAAIPFGSVSLRRENYEGGITGGYSRYFEIKRGKTGS